MVDVVCYPTNMTLHENVVAGMNLYLNTENNNEKKAPFYLMHFNEWPCCTKSKSKNINHFKIQLLLIDGYIHFDFNMFVDLQIIICNIEIQS